MEHRIRERSAFSIAVLFVGSSLMAILGLAEVSEGGPDSFGIGSLFVPEVYPSGGTTRMIINVTAPEVIPNGSYLVINVTDPNGELDQTKEALDPSPYHDYAIPLFLSVPGIHTIGIGFESDGSYIEARSVECLAVDADLVQDWEDAGGWTYHGSDPSLKVSRGDELSPGGGRALLVGTGSGPSFVPGFHAEMDTYVQSPLLDLGNSSKGTLYIYHKRSFQGPLGSCGGIVQAVSGDSVEALVPEDGYDVRLRDNMSGGLGGQRAFSGEAGWSLSTFDLGLFLDKEVQIRIAAVSDGDGYGNWSVDDVFMELAGPVDVDPPGIVSDLKCSVLSDGSVLVSWVGPSDPDVEGYNIYLSDSELTEVSGETPFVSVLPGEDLVYTLRGLLRERRYWVAVTAYDGSGNERSSVESVSFIIEEGGPNKPPVAVILVVSQPPYRVGSEIELSARSSYDPEGDDLIFYWTLPDGSRRLGERIGWTPQEMGTSVIIRLQARDQWGATNESYVDLTVEGASEDIIWGDMMKFLMLVIPVALVMIIAFSIVALIRSRRRRKLEMDLEEVGIVHRPQFNTDCNPAPSKRKVLDLVPVAKPVDHATSTHHTVKRTSLKPSTKIKEARVPPPPQPPIGHDHHKAHSNEGEDGRSAHVNVTLECPCCGRSFRQRMVRTALKGRSISVKCPHCGSEGEI